MTRHDFTRAELLAAAIATVMEKGTPFGSDNDEYDRGTRFDARAVLTGDQWRGYAAGGTRQQPPDTVDGWAGWLAAHITGWAL